MPSSTTLRQGLVVTISPWRRHKKFSRERFVTLLKPHSSYSVLKIKTNMNHLYSGYVLHYPMSESISLRALESPLIAQTQIQGAHEAAWLPAMEISSPFVRTDPTMGYHATRYHYARFPAAVRRLHSLTLIAASRSTSCR
jgi:hypothetical protein